MVDAGKEESSSWLLSRGVNSGLLLVDSEMSRSWKEVWLPESQLLRPWRPSALSAEATPHSAVLGTALLWSHPHTTAEL